MDTRLELKDITQGQRYWMQDFSNYQNPQGPQLVEIVSIENPESRWMKIMMKDVFTGKVEQFNSCYSYFMAYDPAWAVREIKFAVQRMDALARRIEILQGL